jgi:hypothetical protein
VSAFEYVKSGEKGLLVFTDVIIGASGLINPCDPLEASVGQIFLVDGPTDSFLLEEVNDCRHIFRNGNERVSVKSKVFATNDGHIIWLRGMGDSVTLSQKDALLREEFEVGYDAG